MPDALAIAVDARPLSYRLVGIGRYTHELLDRLVVSTPQWRWFLYSTDSIPKRWHERENVIVRSLSKCPPASSSLLAQTVFPYWARKDGVDVFWSPRHHLPFFLPDKIQKVVTVHDLVWAKYPETMSRFGRFLDRVLMPTAVSHSSTVCVVSESTRADLAVILKRHDRVQLVPPASSFCGDSRCVAIPSHGDYFLFVGTLEPRKNLKRLLAAYRMLIGSSGSDWPRLVIVGGEGWGDVDLDHEIASVGLSDYVDLKGFVTNEELRDLYHGAFALVMPSIYEGFGMPLLEAMSVGVPVITSNVSSMPEVAGEAGLLVDPFDVDSIVGALRLISTNQPLYQQLSAAAIEHSKSFNWDTSAQRMEEILASVANS